MPTYIHGRNTRIVVAGSDLSEFTDSTEVTDGREVHKVTSYGPTRKRHSKQLGLGDGKITIKGTHASDANGPRKVLEALMELETESSFLLQHQGVGSGLPQLAVNVVVSTYNESLPVDDMIKWTSDLEMSGDRSTADQV